MKAFRYLFLSAVLALGSVAASAASYYVVAPLKGKAALVENISVSVEAGGLPAGVIGAPYAADLKPLLSVKGDGAYTGSGVTWSVASGALPAGLALNSEGVVVGVPTASASDSFAVRATYRTKYGEQTYQILVASIQVGLAPATLPQGLVGQAYSYDLKPLLSVTGDASYAGAGVSWSVESGALPSGLSLDASSGLISGTPAAAVNASLQLKASYRGESGAQAYQLVTLNISVALASATPPQAMQGQAYSYDFKPLLSVSGDPAYSNSSVGWAVSTGSLPSGLNFSPSTGVLSGTPDSAGTYNFNLRATYRGQAAERGYAVSVAPPSYQVEYLVIGGGGGGASNNGNGASSGGGGAGGYRSSVAGELSGGGAQAEPAFTVVKGATYSVVVGGAGAPGSTGSSQPGSKGGDSSFGPIVALGGGGGGAPYPVAGSVGSGGGAGAGPVPGAPGTPGQGFAGGEGDNGSSTYRSGGGGGAGSGGQSGAAGSNGGAGLPSSITGTQVYRAGGGAGGRWNGGTGYGGLGGGGASGSSASTSTGGGGGGARLSGAAGWGGSGIVLIRYAGPQRGTGGTVTSAGGYTIHTFTNSGTFKP